MSTKLMKKNGLLFLALLTAVVVTGCASEPFEQTRVRVGMSRDDLKFYFGEPLRIETSVSGGEDWYYRFVTSAAPALDGAVSRDAFEGSDSVSVSVSTAPASKEVRPIHLGADGYVIEPIPEGKILGR